MKKLTMLISSLILALCAVFGLAACGEKNGDTVKVYVPDGAPALALARNMDDGYYGKNFPVSVVDATTISTYVTGENPQADICILPVNAGVKALGSGTKYRMLGTVTHGNLFILKKQDGQNISSAADLNTLVGKTVGVINLENVPGLTFKVIIQDNGLEFNDLKDGAAPASDKINLVNVNKSTVTPGNEQCDYFVVSEPAASTKTAATQGKLSIAGSLQTLYGGNSGYPQAIVVAKKSLIENRRDELDDWLAEFDANIEWLTAESTTSQIILDRITSHYLKADTSPAFTADNLTAGVIGNCGLKFVNSANSKTEIISFMQKLNGVSQNAWGMPSDDFFA